MLGLETSEERERRLANPMEDLGSLIEWDAVNGMESVAVQSAVPDRPEPATYRRGRKVGSRGTVVRRSQVSEHRNLYVQGADDERGHVRDLAANLEARADMLLMADAAKRTSHADDCDCSACEYPTGVRTVGTATRAWAQTTPEGMAGMVQHVAWHHDTLADSMAAMSGASWHDAEQWADDMGADPPTRRTDTDRMAWSGSTASTLQHAVRGADGEYVLDDKDERTYTPTVLAEVGAYKDGRHWNVKCYGTRFTTWSPADKVATTIAHRTGGGWADHAPRRLIIGRDGRPVRIMGRGGRVAAVRDGERVQAWQTTGRTWQEHTSTVVRASTRHLVKRARLTFTGDPWKWTGEPNGTRPGREQVRARRAARSRAVVACTSSAEMVAAIADLEPGGKVRLQVAMATVSVRRLDQSDPVYRVSITAGKRGQRRGADGAAAWIAERVL